MKSSDWSTIAAVGVLVAALVAFLTGFGVSLPLWIPASIPLVVGVAIFGLRAYVAFVGADNTSVDERLETAERLIQSTLDEGRFDGRLATAGRLVRSVLKGGTFDAREAPTVKDR